MKRIFLVLTMSALGRCAPEVPSAPPTPKTAEKGNGEAQQNGGALGQPGAPHGQPGSPQGQPPENSVPGGGGRDPAPNPSPPPVPHGSILLKSGNSWTVPEGVTAVTVEIWGAGGNGGAVSYGDQTRGCDAGFLEGGGGGGGGYASRTLFTTGLSVINFSIGLSGGMPTTVGEMVAEGGKDGRPGDGGVACKPGVGGEGGKAIGGTTNVPGEKGSPGEGFPGAGGSAGNASNAGANEKPGKGGTGGAYRRNPDQGMQGMIKFTW